MSEYESNTPMELAYYEKETDKGNETPDSKTTALKNNQSNEDKKIKCWIIICFIEFSFYCLNPVTQIILYIINNNGGAVSFLYFGSIFLCGILIISYIMGLEIQIQHFVTMILIFLGWGCADFFFNDIKAKNEKYENLITAIYCLKIAEAANFFLLMISVCCLHVADGEKLCCFN